MKLDAMKKVQFNTNHVKEKKKQIQVLNYTHRLCIGCPDCELLEGVADVLACYWTAASSQSLHQDPDLVQTEWHLPPRFI